MQAANAFHIALTGTEPAPFGREGDVQVQTPRAGFLSIYLFLCTVRASAPWTISILECSSPTLHNGKIYITACLKHEKAHSKYT